MDNIVSLLQKSFKDNSNNYALKIDENYYSYFRLDDLSNKIKNSLLNHISSTNNNVGIYAYRSFNAYAGIIGTIRSNFTYVPINPNFPAEKIKF